MTLTTPVTVVETPAAYDSGYQLALLPTSFQQNCLATFSRICDVTWKTFSGHQIIPFHHSPGKARLITKTTPNKSGKCRRVRCFSTWKATTALKLPLTEHSYTCTFHLAQVGSQPAWCGVLYLPQRAQARRQNSSNIDLKAHYFTCHQLFYPSPFSPISSSNYLRKRRHVEGTGFRHNDQLPPPLVGPSRRPVQHGVLPNLNVADRPTDVQRLDPTSCEYAH